MNEGQENISTTKEQELYNASVENLQETFLSYNLPSFTEIGLFAGSLLNDESFREKLRNRYSADLDEIYRQNFLKPLNKVIPLACPFHEMIQKKDNSQLQIIQNYINELPELSNYKTLIEEAKQFYELLDYFDHFWQVLLTKLQNWCQNAAQHENADQRIREEIVIESDLYLQNVQKLKKLANPQRQPSVSFQEHNDNNPEPEELSEVSILETLAENQRASMPKKIRNPNRNTICEPDSNGYKWLPVSRWEQFKRYVKANPKKLILGGLLAGGGVALVGFFWPIILPTFLLTAIGTVGTISVIAVIAAITGTTLTGIFHYLTDKKEQKRIKSDKRVFLHQKQASIKIIKAKDSNNKVKPKIFNQAAAQTSPVVKAASSDIQKQEKNLRLLLKLSKYSVMTVIENFNRDDLVSLVKTHLIANPINIQDFVRLFVQDEENLYSLDFEVIKNACRESFSSFDIKKYLDIDLLKQALDPIRIKVFLGYYNAGTSNADITSIQSEDVAYRYCYLKYFKNEADLADKLVTLFKLIKTEDNNIENDIKRIKNTIIYLILHLNNNQSSAILQKLKPNELFQLFAEIISKTAPNEVMKICSKGKFIPNPQKYDFDVTFLLIKDVYKESELITTGTVANELQNLNTFENRLPTWNCIKIFLKNMNPLLQVTKLSDHDLIDIFYKNLEKHDVKKVISNFKSVQFNNYLTVDESNFLEIIKQYYEQYRPEINFEAEQKKLSLPESVNYHVRLNTMRLFVSYSGEIDLDKKALASPKKLYLKFYEVLNRLSVEEVVSVYSQLQKDDSYTKSDNYFPQLLSNYFEFIRPDEFETFYSKMHDNKFYNQPESKVSTDTFFGKKNQLWRMSQDCQEAQKFKSDTDNRIPVIG